MSKIKPLKIGRSESVVMAQVLEAAQMLGIEMKRRNVGGFHNASGQYVAFGEAGDSDLTGQVPSGPKKGARLDIEIKREGFDPAKVRGAERERFDGQLARLRETNARGGVGFFCDNAEVFIRVMRIVLRGGRVEERGEGGLVVYDPEIQP